MLRRHCIPLLLTLAAAALLAATAPGARAATVDPGLRAELAAKGAGEMVDVLMLFPATYDLEALDRSLEGASPEARRAAVIAALKQRAAAAQSSTRELLDAAARDGRAAGVRVLWMVNGLAFRGDASVVEAIAASKAEGTLLHDRPYDWLSAVTPPGGNPAVAAAPAPAGPAVAAAPTDTVWSVKWVKANRVWLDTGYMGAGVVVGHFDTGAWLTHPDLAGRLWTNPGEIAGNALDDDGNGYVDDVHGYDFGNADSDPNDDVTGSGANHGTHTAGSVLGDGTNGTATGVAPAAQLMVCKVMRTDGTGASFTSIYEAHQYAIEMGARVFTQSLGLGGNVAVSLMQAERYNAEAIRVAGVAFFAAGGNDRANYNPPYEISVTARVPAPWHAAGVRWSSRGGVVAVGGTAYRSNTSYTSSSMGPAYWGDVPPWSDWPGPTGIVKPDICAPASGVNSLQKPSGYTGDTWSGTSMATPHAAGVAALMLSKNPSLSPAGIDSIIEQTGTPLGTAGKDNTFGNGQINALAAVNAVPLSLSPYLARTVTTMTDPGADGILDPGETVSLVVEVTNNSAAQAAAGVTLGLAVDANAYVSIADGAATLPDLAAGGGAATNAGDPFQIAIGAGTPQGFVFRLRLTMAAAGGYQTTEDIAFTVGLPEYRDHDVGAVRLTVTDQAILGYMNDTGLIGSGFGWDGEASVLFLGSFWGGTGATYICNRDFSGVGAGTTVETYEWVTTTTPNGRVAVLSGGPADQTYQSVFSDAGHATPRNIQVTQRSYAWADPGSEDFVVLKYTIRNNGATSITDYHAGVFCDFDLGDSGANFGASQAARHMVYMYETTAGPYVGIALLSPHTHKNLTFIDNPTYVYPEGSIADDIKARHLRNLMSMPTAATASDYSALVSAGGFTIPAGGEIAVAFALVMGTDLADLAANVDQAQLMYYTTPVDDLPPASVLKLEQNLPNPFNPRTEIRFTTSREGPVALTIFDLAGRAVRSLARQTLPAGDHAVAWDGTDGAGTRLPSGMYLYRLEADGRQLTRKMMLVK